MVMKFTRKDDLRQACYEATIDLTHYTEHLKGIADRCEENFPEVAECLRGTAAGIGKYFRGIDGEWVTAANEQLRADLSTPEFHDHLWAYEFCRDPRAALLLFGNMVGIAAAKPDLTFWETLKASRTKLSDMAPLIEKLLGTSPLRAQ